MKSLRKIQTLCCAASVVVAITFIATAVAQAQVPPDIAAKLVEIGKGVCVPQTAKLYAPLQPKPPASGIAIMRDISYADDPQTIMDVFAAEKGGGSRPVLVYVSGGGGDKKVTGPDGDPFYDNIMFWAVKNGMVGVNMQRRGGLTGGGLAWDEPAKDVGRVVAWIRQNITKYKGNPNRIFLWADSAGNVPVSTFAGHPEIAGENGAAVKGIVLMSSPNFNISPETVPAPPPNTGGGNPFGACGGAPVAARGGDGRGAGPGRGAGAGAPPRGGGGPPAPLDPATQLARSNLPGLAKGKIAVFVGWGELDPPNIMTFDETLKAALCKEGRCPTTAFFKDHSHVSLVFSPNTADNSVTGPILKWMKGVK